MPHATDGVLRRLIDEPAGVSDGDRAHIAGCPECLAGLATARADATVVGSALRVDGIGELDSAAAWHRLSTALAGSDAPAPAPARRRARLRSPLVAALGVMLVLAGAGAAAAGDWLQIFRTEQIAPITISNPDLVALPDLSGFGDLQVSEQPDVHQVATLAEAEAASGLDAPRVPGLPQGVTGDPAITVGSRLTATFTFSAAKAEQAAAAAGETLPPPPPGLDGARFRLTAGPGLAEIWTEGRGVPALVVARLVAPTAFSSGVPFATARDYLLSLPGLPDDLAAQLRGFTADGTTLPLPVPAQLVSTSTADVDGTTATVLASKDGTMAGVVWVRDGIVTGVAGTLSTDEVLAVARGLR